MGASTFSLVVFAVLAIDLIEEFELDRWQIGALVTATAISGAVISPMVGTLTDRIGARNATVATLLVSGGALVAIAVAPVFAVLAVFALIGGVGQSIANPATNKLISMHTAFGSRGFITGIKQSGVQFGTFIGGLLLPAIAISYGWRWAVVVFGIASVVGGVMAMAGLPADTPNEPRVGSALDESLPRLIPALAWYGFLLGFGGTAIFTYLPLYAQETLEFSKQTAGYLVAFLGSVGVIGRIGWGHMSERRLGAIRSLEVIAVMAFVSPIILIVAQFAPWLAWIAAVTTGLSASAWNAVGMLAIIQSVPTRLAGRGSGVVLFGFLMGLGLGAPSFGYSVDRFGTYVPGWVAAAVVFASSLLVTRRHTAQPVVPCP